MVSAHTALPTSSLLDPRGRATLAGHFRNGSRAPVPMDDPRPFYSKFSSRLKGMAVDWVHNEVLLSADDPALLTYVGEGGTSELEPRWKKAGIDGVAIVVEGAGWKGANSIHVPPVTGKTLAADGKTPSVVRDRVLEFFREQASAEKRTVAPEVRPNRRTFVMRVEVELVAAAADTSMHYTTDGSEPTAASPAYKGPVPLTKTTTVKAIAIGADGRSSGVTTAVYIADAAHGPPTITEPKPLPRGKVGQVYSVDFAAEPAAGAVKPVRWLLQGQHRNAGGPNAPKEDKGFANYVGLSIDPETGRLHGTPKRAGAYVLQVQAYHFGAGLVADSRTCLLVIEPLTRTPSKTGFGKASPVVSSWAIYE
ncbi:MAG: hypothetical protein C0501_19020 [Isosphaera sp.]|nr:hypothetical protein [Isosphaera sp.]